MMIILTFFAVESNFYRVHSDEIKIRDWIASVHGSSEYRVDSDRHITIVRLNRCNISDDDIVRLRYLSHLKELDLSDTSISDNAIPTILSLSNLRYLRIDNTQITIEGGWQIVNARPELCVYPWPTYYWKVHPDEIEAYDWITSARGVITYQYDRPERHITDVDLSGRNINDEDLIYLKTLAHITKLNLSHTDITDEAIPHINELISLQFLDIRFTKITEEGLEKIDLPNLQMIVR